MGNENFWETFEVSYSPAININTMGDQRFWELCRDGDIEGVQAAIYNGADVNEEDQGATGGLMYALYNTHNDVVQLLLNHPQIDVNKVNRNGKGALHYAVVGVNQEGLAALLARQDLTTINQRNRNGWSPIVHAVEWNAVNCFNLLVADPRLDLDTRDNYQRSPEEVYR